MTQEDLIADVQLDDFPALEESIVTTEAVQSPAQGDELEKVRSLFLSGFNVTIRHWLMDLNLG